MFRQIVKESRETVYQFMCRLCQQAISCEFGAGDDDYIRNQVTDKCYSNHFRRKFLEKEGAITLDDLKVRMIITVNFQFEQFDPSILSVTCKEDQEVCFFAG